GRLIEIGPELSIAVGPSQKEREAAQRAGRLPPEPQPVKALIDTGSRLTIITPKAAKRCGLLPVSPTTVFVVGGGEVNADVYSARIVFTDTSLATWPTIEIVGTNLHHAAIECLIGRDILRRWIMHYDGPSGQLIVEEPE